MGLLDGKVCIVSGAGPGLGRAIATAFAAEGASVAISGRRLERLERLAAGLRDTGASVLPVVCDVTDPAACRELATTVAGELGGIDVLVNNAFHDGDFQAVMDADLDLWRRVMDVNLFGTAEMTRAAVPYLRSSGDGRVIMINTMSVQRVNAGFAAYGASKGALATLTKFLAQELGPDGIRVNGVHPGYIWGRSVEWFFGYQAEQRGVSPETVYDEVAAETCLRYLPDGDEVAGAVVFLASQLARAVTGQSLNVNAGHWLS